MLPVAAESFLDSLSSGSGVSSSRYPSGLEKKKREYLMMALNLAKVGSLYNRPCPDQILLAEVMPSSSFPKPFS